MTADVVRMRQLVDWSAAVWAGIVAGSVFLILNLILIPQYIGGNAWIVLRYIASLVLGTGVLPPPDTANTTVLIVALLLNFALSIIFALILAAITHQWGLIIGMIVGALFGLGLYFINLYTLTLIFPWFFVMNSNLFMWIHVLFGLVAGATYEILEVEEFVPIMGEVSNG